MISGKKVLAVIPARGGSKGVYRKNIRLLGGKPLIAWTIATVSASRFVDRAVVSTDDEEIARIAVACGGDVPFIRPASLSGDNVSGVEPVIHAVSELPGYDYVVLLQPTSPFRTTEDVDACIQKCHEAGVFSCISVTEIHESPYWMFCITNKGRITPLLSQDYLSGKQRQDLPRTVVLNGAVYVARVRDIIRIKSFFATDTIGYEMPRDRSLDIDTPHDFELAEYHIEKMANLS